VTAGRAIVLNGTSSAGKTSLARAVQDRLDGWWLLLGIDTLITAMPWRMFGTPDGHTINADGSIEIGPGWRLAHDRWRSSLGALVRAGANVILDEVFLEGAEDQARWRQTLDGLAVTWVGVQCDVEVAAAREAARGDRVPHIARFQAAVVHEGVDYDVVVDTTVRSPEELADVVIAHVATG
jgi:chloramphenicol 3-O phosphotransferase